jgi:hypothetical protein
MSGRRNCTASAGTVLAPVLLLISTIWLPWASYRSTNLDVALRSGSFGSVLIICGAGSLGLVAVSLFWNRPIVYWLHLILGCSAVLCSGAVALAKIADANHITSSSPGYAATTSFGIGAGVAVVSSVVMSVSSWSRLKANNAPKSSETGLISEGACTS